MREDHSKWLIHFVRDRVPEQDSLADWDIEADIGLSGELESDADAFTVLRTIIRLGGLLSGYSIRSGRTTIYGGKPVVCATEMPLYSFAVYARSRGDTKKVSAYGIAFLKSEFFAAGGRPVIYGLSSDVVTYRQNDKFSRILDPTILPIREQFRYVTYNPTPSNWVDWSHEREWRWVAQNETTDYIWCQGSESTCGPMPGLPLFTGPENNGHFSRVGIIVWSAEEAAEVQRLLTGLFFAQSNDYDTPFNQETIRRSFIVVLERVIRAVEADRKLSVQTIEGLEAAQLIQPILLSPPPIDAEKRIRSAILAAANAGGEAAIEYATHRTIDSGTCGYAYAVTRDITNGLIQYMLQHGYASGPFDGAAHIRIPESWAPSQSIEYNEYVYNAVAQTLAEQLNVSIYMRSSLD